MLAEALFGMGVEEGPLPIGFEQPFDIARRQDAGGERAFAGELEPVRAVAAGEPEHPQTGAQAFLGVLARVEQPVDIGADGKPECRGVGASSSTTHDNSP